MDWRLIAVMALSWILTMTPGGETVPVRAPTPPENVREDSRMWWELMKMIPALPWGYFQEKDTWAGSGTFSGLDPNGVAQVNIRRGAPPSRFTVNH